MKIEEIKEEKSYRCTVYNFETDVMSHEILSGANLLTYAVYKDGRELIEDVRKVGIDQDDVIYTYKWILNPVIWGDDFIAEIEGEALK